MLLYDELYEREGNDAWLKDYIQLHLNGIGLYLDHKKRWNGWNGEIIENNTLELDQYDIEKSQKMLDEYLHEHNLDDAIVIKLIELVRYN